MKVKTYSDGGARGNPGPGAIGAIVCSQEDEIIQEYSDYIGESTNNIAEYCALIAALELAKNVGANEVESFLDSELLTKQLNGEYRIKSEHIKKLFQEVKSTEKIFKKVSYQYLPALTKRSSMWIV